MDHSELVELIRGGVDGGVSRWADLGSGTGAFTAALADLLGPGSQIVAVDKDRGALEELERRLERRPDLSLEVRAGDFTRPLGLHDLDGVLMANSLHFIRDKAPVVRSVRQMLRPGGTLLVVEYGSDCGNPWVPYPFSYPSWEAIASAAGFTRTRQVGTRPDRHLGSMYAAASS